MQNRGKKAGAAVRLSDGGFPGAAAARRRRWLTGLAVSLWLAGGASAAADSSPTNGVVQWLDLPHPQLEICGLPWFKENAPDLWRLPKRAQTRVPKGVWNRAVSPGGGRIRLSCNSSCLGLRLAAVQPGGKRCCFDAFVNGQYAGSVSPQGTQRVDRVIFANQGRAWKDITLYLPHRNEVRVFAVGLDADAELRPPPPFAQPRPLVCYGSSVLQGTGALHPAQTYPAALARRLNLDFVNLGFGGAGKAEPEVVALVNQLDAGAYLFDLGKSYGAPEPERYNRMLDAIRAAHPTAPIFCVTPIYSTREAAQPDYRQRSEALRALMRRAAEERRQAGDPRLFVVEGLELFGEPDKALLADAAHPGDEGNELMARRLAARLEEVLGGRGQPLPGGAAARTNAAPPGARP
ncbi:MAG TPA: SGNH/GDSL hydrolase family protein [Verrucomicrobiota bacterium]|nr:hypothetical protein [Verrucomicrobiota bacterium]HRR64509.1 SGNH/GDSL hydrolase family protein [Candidatus Paceibacterota bacterium]MDI9373534.1 SGNH/GDSL hydrolase family protein [Verrucomicrobiota bacterium]NLH86372.1 hypothetical protein [Verrucomicrobiota bacterium]HNR71309.1 SGNH/GDSL hydrolase family protein [Verrucomicrobiota bacterium]